MLLQVTRVFVFIASLSKSGKIMEPSPAGKKKQKKTAGALRDGGSFPFGVDSRQVDSWHTQSYSNA
jgi:hypothetical protein